MVTLPPLMLNKPPFEFPILTALKPALPELITIAVSLPAVELGLTVVVPVAVRIPPLRRS
ncbi:MAG: hypothetical protein QOD99_2364 [Chthoniobacter sp.]|nr:hypothetical protein [Chthoniobacter sp.]